MDKVDLVGMVDMVDMVDSMEMVDNINMVDSKHMVIMQKTCGYLKFLLDTSGWTRWTW